MLTLQVSGPHLERSLRGADPSLTHSLCNVASSQQHHWMNTCCLYLPSSTSESDLVRNRCFPGDFQFKAQMWIYGLSPLPTASQASARACAIHTHQASLYASVSVALEFRAAVSCWGDSLQEQFIQPTCAMSILVRPNSKTGKREERKGGRKGGKEEEWMIGCKEKKTGKLKKSILS